MMKNRMHNVNGNNGQQAGANDAAWVSFYKKMVIGSAVLSVALSGGLIAGTDFNKSASEKISDSSGSSASMPLNQQVVDNVLHLNK